MHLRTLKIPFAQLSAGRGIESRKLRRTESPLRLSANRFLVFPKRQM
jgi:hypothetical protein